MLIACVTQIEHTCREKETITLSAHSNRSGQQSYCEHDSCKNCVYKGKVKHKGNRISFQWKQDCNGSRSTKNDQHVHSLQLTFSPLKIDGWKTIRLPFGAWPIFRCENVSFFGRVLFMHATQMVPQKSRIWGPVVARIIFGREKCFQMLCKKNRKNLILLHISKWWFFTNPFEKYAIVKMGFIFPK